MKRLKDTTSERTSQNALATFRRIARKMAWSVTIVALVGSAAHLYRLMMLARVTRQPLPSVAHRWPAFLPPLPDMSEFGNNGGSFIVAGISTSVRACEVGQERAVLTRLAFEAESNGWQRVQLPATEESEFFVEVLNKDTLVRILASRAGAGHVVVAEAPQDVYEAMTTQDGNAALFAQKGGEIPGIPFPSDVLYSFVVRLEGGIDVGVCQVPDVAAALHEVSVTLIERGWTPGGAFGTFGPTWFTTESRVSWIWGRAEKNELQGAVTLVAYLKPEGIP